MVSHWQAGFILLLAAGALAASEADTVNERIPVSKTQLEAHWGVDCAGLAGQLRGDMGRAFGGKDCGVTPSLLTDLQLCAFIYQPPGGNGGHRCPDYRAALEALNTAAPERACPTLVGTLLAPEDCPASARSP